MLGRSWLSSLKLGRWQRYGDVKSHFCRSMSGKRGPSLEEQESARRALEAAAREDRLDFATAAKILMTTPAKERKFGWDFHLVQFFFACLPPLAAYLVAQYSRHEQRRMLKDAKLEKIIAAEFETEVESELQEAAIILSTNDTDLALLSLRLQALEARLKQLEPAVLKARIVDHPAEEAARHDVEGGKKQSTDNDVEESSSQLSRDEDRDISNLEDEHGDDDYWRWWRWKRDKGEDKKPGHEQDSRLDQQSHQKQMKQEHQ
ncbi:unnamed protein product [Sphagnum troendelagicum]|uniref:Uncharacterized protein n=1 Tax=Sphagnum troendelagicum TaxID=128251 RepID=A0ABP0UMW6_9BRYO